MSRPAKPMYDAEFECELGALDIAAAAAFVCLSERLIAGEVAAGRIESFKVGARRLMTRRAVVRWLARHLEQTRAGELPAR